MKRMIPLLVGFFPSLFALTEMFLISANTDIFLLLVLIGTLVFLPAWWAAGYLCGKLKRGILWPTVLANVPLFLGLLLFCLDNSFTMPKLLGEIGYLHILPLFSIYSGISFTGSAWIGSLICMLPAIAVFWLGCSKSDRR
ncbi:MAG: hypothetical protein E7437_09430 [Ruminococcaceae bacterium]|nr:hypothetical protein [Oscillospiraceae bacterium]